MLSQNPPRAVLVDAETTLRKTMDPTVDLLRLLLAANAFAWL